MKSVLIFEATGPKSILKINIFPVIQFKRSEVKQRSGLGFHQLAKTKFEKQVSTDPINH